MNIVEAWDDFTSSEKLMFQNCCRKILRRTFLVRDKQDDRKHYFFVVNHIDSFLNYFSFMGFEVKCDDAIKQQLKKAKSDKVVLEQEENRLIEDSKILSQYIADIDAVNWDETRYIFDIQKRIDEKKTEVQNKKAELAKIENTPGFAAALQEKESADKEYKEADGQFINVNNCISTCKEKIRDNEEKYDESEQHIEKAKHEYDNAILQRLELRKEMVELYDKLWSYVKI